MTNQSSHHPTTIGKIWGLLTPPERKSTVILLLLMFIGMSLEILVVGLVIPALALLTQPDYATKFPAIRPILQTLGNPSQNALFIGSMLALVAIYTVKAMFLTLLAWYQARLAYGLRAEWSHRLFSLYLRQPYTFHLQRNSAQLIHNTVSQVDQFTSAIVVPGMILLVESLVFLGLSVMLMTVEPLGTVIVVTVLGAAGWSFHRVTRGSMTRWGEAAQRHEALRFHHLAQGLGGVKDVKLLGRESGFLEQFHTHTAQRARAARLQSTLQQLPRVWLELLAVGGLAALVITMLAQGLALAAILPTLGMFAVAAFRLLPSVNRILGTIQLFKYAKPIIDNVYVELSLPTPEADTHISRQAPFERTLELHHVAYAYPGAANQALSNITLTIQRGESVGFVGPSGAGKSTLVDILLGLLTPVDGEVRVDGHDIQSGLRHWQDQIGYVPQAIFLTDDTLRRNVAFGLPNAQIEEAAVRRAIRAAQLEEFVDGLPAGLDTVVGERGVRLSGGQRQRIGIARALYHDPAVLVLDEATSALDTATERGVMEAVRALQGTKTVIIVAHRLSTVQYCSRLYRLEKGRMVEPGGYSEAPEYQKVQTEPNRR
ncbi:MAG: ABC transporter ATP-binding protein [Vicinamibacterales bacterium]|nr:ABC transporter ATP-binding protein [Vicinamibacterales bacterium]